MPVCLLVFDEPELIPCFLNVTTSPSVCFWVLLRVAPSLLNIGMWIRRVDHSCHYDTNKDKPNLHLIVRALWPVNTSITPVILCWEMINISGCQKNFRLVCCIHCPSCASGCSCSSTARKRVSVTTRGRGVCSRHSCPTAMCSHSAEPLNELLIHFEWLTAKIIHISNLFFYYKCHARVWLSSEEERGLASCVPRTAVRGELRWSAPRAPMHSPNYHVGSKSRSWVPEITLFRSTLVIQYVDGMQSCFFIISYTSGSRSLRVGKCKQVKVLYWPH